ncbi:hypothetical protein CYMTET_50585 [Cymbomonas tetramitiformis]|uniref:Ubiquitin-like domain-containing protein n=1 Tax=Cymbomonas tetramitiformis TaxID=36881 RepID=A0AAE0BPH8_9CHLO|nr:hypothetical protein CYMTET_50585 [Cymbomonas tetramitiformis]
MVLQVLVAHTGKTFELDCQGHTRVEIVQQALASLTAVPPQDQILMCGGTKIDGARSLNAYGLPSDEGNKRVFLYNKMTLKPGCATPVHEAIEPILVEVPSEPSLHCSGHPLDSASSPLIRALPYYERQFKFHLMKGQAIWRASQARLDICRRMVSEMHVQVLAIDSARENVEVHFNYICKAQDEFIKNYSQQQIQHEELLANFDRDMEKMRSIELHPALRTSTRRTLIDCAPETKLRSWAVSCDKSHKSFASKVSELSSMFGLLQRNVEELLMTGPDVDVAQLEERLEDAQKYEEEETTILQSLSKDLGTVQKLVEDTVAQLSNASLSSSLRPVDACAALDPMNELHTTAHLPKIEESDTQLERLVVYFSECKVVLSRNVHTQLQSIAALQSKIRDLRYKLTAFKEVGTRQASAFLELRLVRHVPAQYHACLAEVVRRRAYAELYSDQAVQLAERMAHIRDKEIARREKFVKQQESYLPVELLQKMGLYSHPPPCEVTLGAGEQHLLDISDQDLRGLTWAAAVPSLAGAGASSQSTASPAPTLRAGAAGVAGSAGDEQASESGSQSGSSPKVGSLERGMSPKVGSVEGPMGESLRSLEFLGLEPGSPGSAAGMVRRDSGATKGGLEMARLRAELASHAALLAALGPELEAAAALDSEPRQQAHGEATGGEHTEEVPLKQKALTSVAAAKKVAEALEKHKKYAEELEHELAAHQKQGRAHSNRIHQLEEELKAAAAKASAAERPAPEAAAKESAAEPGKEEAGTRGDAGSPAAKEAAGSSTLHSLLELLGSALRKANEERQRGGGGKKRQAEAEIGQGAGASSGALSDLSVLEKFVGGRERAEPSGGVSVEDLEGEDFKVAVSLISGIKELVEVQSDPPSMEVAEQGVQPEPLASSRFSSFHKQQLCFSEFSLGHVAVFLPNGRGQYEGLNEGCPHRYLSDECVATFLSRRGESHAVPHIVGQILRDEVAVASGGARTHKLQERI